MGLYPRNFNEYIASLGIPRHEDSQVYLVDVDNGVAGRNGKTLETTLDSVEEAYGLCTTDQHDVVLMISSDSGNNLAAAIDWSKDFTHLVGLSSNLNGVGQRCRIVGVAAADVVYTVDFSGKGCIVRNIKFCNESDADVDSGGVIVSGGRNEFTNCAFEGMVHATPAARANGYSLKLTGEENEFNRCSIGVDTIVRAADNAELWVSTGAVRNAFIKCRFLSASETTTKFLVWVENTDRWLEFEDCVFYNFSTNWANNLADAFRISCATTHHVILRGKNILVGVDGWADVLTHLYSAEPVPAGGFGIGTNPTG